MAKYVPFQKWRLFWFGVRMAGQASKYVETHPDVARAYTFLVELTKQAMEACNERKQDHFLTILDELQRIQALDELDRLRSGLGDEVPEWLKK